MLPPLRDHVRRVLGELSGRRACDLVADIGRPILYGALGRMLGLDGAGADKAAELSKSVFHAGLGPTGSPLTPDGFRAVFEFLGEQVAKRSADRGDDIISVLLNAKDAGAPTSDQEVVANMTTVLLAGNASIGHYFTNLMYALWRFPDARARVRSDLTRVDDAVEEGVRWDTSTQCFARQTTRDVTIAGTVIPADSRLVVLYASANRDERAILEPDHFDVSRAKVRHLGSARARIFASGANGPPHAPRDFAGVAAGARRRAGPDQRTARAHLMVRGFYRLPMRWWIHRNPAHARAANHDHECTWRKPGYPIGGRHGRSRFCRPQRRALDTRGGSSQPR